MKLNNILKGSLVTFISFYLISCSHNVGSGVWENIVKNADGSSVVTTLAINETQNDFTGSMTSVSSGVQTSSDSKIDFSGYVSSNILVIEQLSKTTDPYFRRSTLTVSEDGKTMVLAPSGLVFNKK